MLTHIKLNYEKNEIMNNLDTFGQSQPNPRQNFPALEELVLSHWENDGTFQASLDNRVGSETWTFYDGPPFANGLPHYGHLLTGYAKDLFPRFQTMLGKHVPRQFGWDTHGLPAELEAMKQLGLTEKADVERMGVDVFNQEAKDSVLRYVDEWREYVTRQGRWVDFDGGYKTLDLNYMESVLWAFKKLHDQGLAYEGYRVLPYCWKDQTPLSTHELNMDDDVYKVRQDMTATVSFPFMGEKAEALGLVGVSALAWTTTPWTLPMNLALAVNPEMVYSVVAHSATTEKFLLAQSSLDGYYDALGYETFEEATQHVTSTFTGAQLTGVKYEPLWDYYTDVDKWGTENAWQVLTAEYVTDGNGTGLVHLAPAHGEEDQKTCEANGVPAFLSVDEGAVFLPDVKDFANLNVFDAVKPVLKAVDAKNRLFSTKMHNHDYPHCWRCGTPLVYKAVSSWFVKVTQVRDRMVELNEEVNWTPENVKHGVFGNWVANARDWSVSRNRYWGSPVPVWKSDNPAYPRVDVYGSLQEIEKDFGVQVTDLHRPFVDSLVRPNPDDPTGNSMMRRVEDVLDVWFDSGAMPFAQMHYPFENVKNFEENHPSDFVVEYVGQSRGWFYVMHVLSTALFDRPAYKNAVSHGVVLGNDGLKMSKKTKNYPDVNDVFNRDGSDAMRWFLMSSSVLRGGTLSVTDKAVTDGMRDVMLPLWNTYSFYRLYADGHTPQWRTNSAHELDQYLLAKLRALTVDMTTSLEVFDSPAASRQLTSFMDMLNNWYVRRSRARFWDGTDVDAFDTLYTVLETVTRLAAPLLPMLTEAVWKGLTGGRSVHLTNYPTADEYPQDEATVDDMDAVREVCSVALSLRKKTGHRVRQPLQSMTLVTSDTTRFSKFRNLLQDELNVKEVVLVEKTDGSGEEFGVVRKLSLNSRAVGKRLGKQAQPVFQAARSGDWVQDGNGLTVAGVTLEEDEYEFGFEHTTDGLAFLRTDDFLMLDTELTPALHVEGFMRDLVRAVQDARKSAGLHVSDRVNLGLVFSNNEDLALFDVNATYLAEETLSVTVDVQSPKVFEHQETVAAGRYTNTGEFTVLLSKA